MAARAMQPDGPVAVADAYYRRNLWLVVFGLAHALLFMWWGEILFPYGLAALLIFQFRTLAPRTLMAIGLVVLLVSDVWFGTQQYNERKQLLHDAPAALAIQAEGKPLSDEQSATVRRWEDLQASTKGTGKDTVAERIARPRRVLPVECEILDGIHQRLAGADHLRGFRNDADRRGLVQMGNHAGQAKRPLLPGADAVCLCHSNTHASD